MRKDAFSVMTSFPQRLFFNPTVFKYLQTPQKHTYTPCHTRHCHPPPTLPLTSLPTAGAARGWGEEGGGRRNPDGWDWGHSPQRMLSPTLNNFASSPERFRQTTFHPPPTHAHPVSSPLHYPPFLYPTMTSSPPACKRSRTLNEFTTQCLIRPHCTPTPTPTPQHLPSPRPTPR